jgi:hypothetical protein
MVVGAVVTGWLYLWVITSIALRGAADGCSINIEI